MSSRVVCGGTRRYVALAQPQSDRDSGVVSDPALTRAMQIAAAFDARLQRLADVDIVVQVPVAGPADPAMRVSSLTPQLVCGPQAETLQLLVEGVLVREEPRDRRAVPAGDRVVVPYKEQATTESGRQSADAVEQRGEERLLAGDLQRAPVTRR